jgi:hypothetical protein
MTTDLMLGRLFALIHGTPPQTSAEFEADAAIRRTLEAVQEWRSLLVADTFLSTLNGMRLNVDALLHDIRDFDPTKED